MAAITIGDEIYSDFETPMPSGQVSSLGEIDTIEYDRDESVDMLLFTDELEPFSEQDGITEEYVALLKGKVYNKRNYPRVSIKDKRLLTGNFKTK